VPALARDMINQLAGQIAWIGITPREHSTGGRRQLGQISKQSLPLA
jgi:transposase